LETIYDWVTVAIFAGLIVLFLQRSSGEGEPEDSIWQYLAASIGCAVANYLGNHDEIPYHDVLAVVVLVGTVAYVWYALKPLKGLK
jgi:hypothetical protein